VLRTVALGAAVALGALMLVPTLLGYERYVITGDSMGETIPRGSIVYARAVPVEDLHTGDVITYTPPGARRKVTHRIVWAGRGTDGVRAFQTRGDANAARDPWRFQLSGRTQARVVAHVPYAGYALGALAVRWVRMLVIGMPSLLIAAAVLTGARRPVERAAA
jgi:signal peptidase